MCRCQWIVTEEATEESQDCAAIQSLPEASPTNMIDLAEWIIPAGEIDEGREQGSEERETDAPGIAVASVQANFLQEEETDREPDTRKVSAQQSLFSGPLQTGEQDAKASRKKSTGYKFQSQLAFNFSEQELPPDEVQGATSQAA